ncbi:hypothetical protein HDU67_008747 [Dinochytrium kinnereticum]|nr:hypothetical protein HDU67_008747 [Dinochytrium kinnereticum]
MGSKVSKEPKDARAINLNFNFNVGDKKSQRLVVSQPDIHSDTVNVNMRVEATNDEEVSTVLDDEKSISSMVSTRGTQSVDSGSDIVYASSSATILSDKAAETQFPSTGPAELEKLQRKVTALEDDIGLKMGKVEEDVKLLLQSQEQQQIFNQRLEALNVKRLDDICSIISEIRKTQEQNSSVITETVTRTVGDAVASLNESIVELRLRHDKDILKLSTAIEAKADATVEAFQTSIASSLTQIIEPLTKQIEVTSSSIAQQSGLLASHQKSIDSLAAARDESSIIETVNKTVVDVMAALNERFVGLRLRHDQDILNLSTAIDKKSDFGMDELQASIALALTQVIEPLTKQIEATSTSVAQKSCILASHQQAIKSLSIAQNESLIDASVKSAVGNSFVRLNESIEGLCLRQDNDFLKLSTTIDSKVASRFNDLQTSIVSSMARAIESMAKQTENASSSFVKQLCLDSSDEKSTELAIAAEKIEDIQTQRKEPITSNVDMTKKKPMRDDIQVNLFSDRRSDSLDASSTVKDVLECKAMADDLTPSDEKVLTLSDSIHVDFNGSEEHTLDVKGIGGFMDVKERSEPVTSDLEPKDIETSPATMSDVTLTNSSTNSNLNFTTAPPILSVVAQIENARAFEVTDEPAAVVDQDHSVIQANSIAIEDVPLGREISTEDVFLGCENSSEVVIAEDLTMTVSKTLEAKDVVVDVGITKGPADVVNLADKTAVAPSETVNFTLPNLSAESVFGSTSSLNESKVIFRSGPTRQSLNGKGIIVDDIPEEDAMRKKGRFLNIPSATTLVKKMSTPVFAQPSSTFSFRDAGLSGATLDKNNGHQDLGKEMKIMKDGLRFDFAAMSSTLKPSTPIVFGSSNVETVSKPSMSKRKPLLHRDTLSAPKAQPEPAKKVMMDPAQLSRLLLLQHIRRLEAGEARQTAPSKSEPSIVDPVSPPAEVGKSEAGKKTKKGKKNKKKKELDGAKLNHDQASVN